MRPARKLCRLAELGAILLVGASPGLATAAADSALEATATDLAADGGLLVWTAQTPGNLSEQLMVGFAGAAAPLRLPTTVRFNGIDLGSDARGRRLLVYSACRRAREPCHDLYAYSFASRRERRLNAVSRESCDESGPQLSRGVLVFARECHEARRRWRGRLARGLYVKRPGDAERRLLRTPPQSFDLDGERLAFARRQARENLPDRSARDVTSEIRVVRLGSARSGLLASSDGVETRSARQGTFLERVRIDSRFVYWHEAKRGVQVVDDILRRPADRSSAATMLERWGRLYAHFYDDGLGVFTISGEHLFYTFGDGPGEPAQGLAKVDGSPLFVDPDDGNCPTLRCDGTRERPAG